MYYQTAKNLSIQHSSDWLHTSQLVRSWLKGRKELLVLFNEANIQNPTAHPDSTVKTLNIFCQILIDYVSQGHFKIFETLAEMVEKYHPEIKGLDPKILNQILLSTEVIVDFNDKYTFDDQSKAANLLQLRQDLSKLGEHLAHRLDWEDELLKAYKQTAMIN